MNEPTDTEIIALNAGEIHFSESPTKYPEAGHGTQYHAGAPGVLSFARAVLAKWGNPAPVGVEPAPSADGPKELWLQLHGDCPPHEQSEPVDYTSDDVTWCWHSIHDSDVRYVRADLAAEQVLAVGEKRRK